jgi:uncharacterized RDD family membrane protein YckC
LTKKYKKNKKKLMQSPGFFRHMAIIAYDSLLLLALLFLATAIILPFNNGEAYTSTQYFFPLYLLSVCFLFYGWFWTHGGQTLGMKTWKIKVLTFDGQPMTWWHAFKRFISAIISWLMLGSGFLWKLIDKKNHTWHDHLSQTSLFFEQK